MTNKYLHPIAHRDERSRRAVVGKVVRLRPLWGASPKARALGRVLERP